MSDKKTAMTDNGFISSIADQYEEQDRFEKQHREQLELKIKELERQISVSYERPIFKILYKPEYGDYNQFVQDVAKELRNRNNQIS